MELAYRTFCQWLWLNYGDNNEELTYNLYTYENKFGVTTKNKINFHLTRLARVNKWSRKFFKKPIQKWIEIKTFAKLADTYISLIKFSSSYPFGTIDGMLTDIAQSIGNTKIPYEQHQMWLSCVNFLTRESEDANSIRTPYKLTRLGKIIVSALYLRMEYDEEDREKDQKFYDQLTNKMKSSLLKFSKIIENQGWKIIFPRYNESYDLIRIQPYKRDELYTLYDELALDYLENYERIPVF